MAHDGRQLALEETLAEVPTQAAPRRRPPSLPRRVARGLGTLQEPVIPAGIWVAMNAPAFEERSDLYAFLRRKLPFNSRSVRDRYASAIAAWSYGAEGVISLPREVWLAYGDEQLLWRVLSACWLLRMPVLRELIIEEICTTPVNEEVPWGRIAAFIERHGGGQSLDHHRKRIPRWLELTGFVERHRTAGRTSLKTMTVVAPPFDRTAFLILLHAELAPSPTTVPVERLLEHPFWRCLGGRDPTQVREALAAAASAGAIDRYTRVDQLEQATTRYSLSELLSRRIRL